jgi:curved DNA-binding protein CbpA
MERALMLMALGLDPRFSYTDTELHAAWRRRIAQVHPDNGGSAEMAAAVNASYIRLTNRIEISHPLDIRL